jgi:putative salt-induced outer membrane protein YdiY
MRDVIQRMFIRPVFALLVSAGTAGAQTTPSATTPTPPPWTGNAGFGLSLSRGNTTTSNLNVTFEGTHHSPTDSVWKFKGLYLRGKNNGTLAVDRLNLEARNERPLSRRVYAFANVQFLEDEFKDIDYLLAPSAGIGYKLIATAVTTLNVDGGLGFKTEQDAVIRGASDVVVSTSARRTDVVVTASDKFEHKLSTTASLTESLGAIWKAQDFGDALYTITAGAAAALTARTQLKIELLDSYASRPPNASVQSNDVALLTALVYKF